MKNNALIVDFGMHYKQIEHASFLWDCYALTTFIPKGKKSQFCSSKFDHVREVNEKFYPFFLLFNMFLYSFKVDKIIVLTGPEYGDSFLYKSLRVLWVGVCYIFDRKIYLYIKNSNAYAKGKILNKTCSMVSLCFFESELQRDNFLSCTGLSKERTRISYVYYSDVAVSAPLDYMASPNVGLIGQFDTNRRDYQMLMDALDMGLLEHVNFIQIGRFVVSEESVAIKEKYSKRITILKDDFTTREIDDLISSCDVLLSMNSAHLGYDSSKGTAAFGEAISSSKILIIPEFLNVYKEFSRFCYFYNSPISLSTSINNALNSKVEKDFFGKYKAKNVLDTFGGF